MSDKVGDDWLPIRPVTITLLDVPIDQLEERIREIVREEIAASRVVRDR